MSIPPQQVSITSNPVSPELLRSIRQFTALAAVAIGVLTLLCRVIDIDFLKTASVDSASMKVNTDLACLMLGSSLLLACAHRKLAGILAALAALLGAAALTQYGAGINWGVDQLLIPDFDSSDFPGRMAPATAVSVVLLALGILTSLRGCVLLAQLMAIPPGCIGMLAIVGYSNNADSLYQLFAFSSIAFQTACWIVLLMFSLLFMEPYKGFMRLFNSDSLGSVTARRLLPPAIVAPVVLSWLGRTGEQAGYYGSSMAAALTSLGMMLVLSLVIYTVALELHRVDLDRRRALLAEANFSGRLRRANVELQQFAYSVSHDIRGPLSTILGLAGLADDDIRDGDLGEAHKAIVEIKQSALSLSRLVHDTLDLTRTDLAEGRLSRISVTQTARQVVEEMARTASNRGVELKVDAEGEAEIETEPTGLKCVLRNLIENAVKYCNPEQPSCWVRVVVRGSAAKGVRIEIADNGLGIAEADQKDVFKVYRRFHPEVAEGRGVGLALVRRQTACLGGTVEFQSGPGGTTFAVTLPPEQAPSPDHRHEYQFPSVC